MEKVFVEQPYLPDGPGSLLTLVVYCNDIQGTTVFDWVWKRIFSKED